MQIVVSQSVTLEIVWFYLILKFIYKSRNFRSPNPESFFGLPPQKIEKTQCNIFCPRSPHWIPTSPIRAGGLKTSSIYLLNIPTKIRMTTELQPNEHWRLDRLVSDTLMKTVATEEADVWDSDLWPVKPFVFFGGWGLMMLMGLGKVPSLFELTGDDYMFGAESGQWPWPNGYCFGRPHFFMSLMLGEKAEWLVNEPASFSRSYFVTDYVILIYHPLTTSQN